MFFYARNKIQIGFWQLLYDEYSLHVNLVKSEAHELYKILIIFNKVNDNYVFSIVFMVSAIKQMICFYLDKRLRSIVKSFQ